MRISDWSSDVCSSDLSVASRPGSRTPLPPFLRVDPDLCHGRQGRARQDAAATFVNYGSGYYPSYRAALDRAEIKGPDDVAIFGDEDDVRRELQRYRDIGVDEIYCIPFGTDRKSTRLNSSH